MLIIYKVSSKVSQSHKHQRHTHTYPEKIKIHIEFNNYMGKNTKKIQNSATYLQVKIMNYDKCNNYATHSIHYISNRRIF